MRMLFFLSAVAIMLTGYLRGTHAEEEEAEFYYGVNVNGPDLTINGHQ